MTDSELQLDEECPGCGNGDPTLMTLGCNECHGWHEAIQRATFRVVISILKGEE